VKSNSVQEENINHLNSSSREIIHIFDETKEETGQISEFIVFRHKQRNRVAIYKIIPFVFTIASGYSVETEKEFWKRDFSQKLAQLYLRYRALKTLKKYCGSSFHHWLNGGLLKDGRYGIIPTLDMKKLGLAGRAHT
jgi:hypothetical protein